MRVARPSVQAWRSPVYPRTRSSCTPRWCSRRLPWCLPSCSESLLESKPKLEQIIHTHEQRAGLLSLLMILFAVVVAVAVWGLGGRSGLSSGAGARETRVAVLDKAMPVLLVVVAVVVLVWVVLTGDAGSRLVWG